MKALVVIANLWTAEFEDAGISEINSLLRFVVAAWLIIRGVRRFSDAGLKPTATKPTPKRKAGGPRLQALPYKKRYKNRASRLWRLLL